MVTTTIVLRLPSNSGEGRLTPERERVYASGCGLASALGATREVAEAAVRGLLTADPSAAVDLVPARDSTAEVVGADLGVDAAGHRRTPGGSANE